ncbi:MAG: TIGR04283 family arsenosugar biosynthesis glycosyltransferase [Thermosynechococcaceae cyanobacterium]
MTSSTAAAPDLSVIIPVLNEGYAIRAVLEQLAAIAETVTYEVIVVDGDPQGATLTYLPLNSNLQGILAQAGRGHQMNAGAALAKGAVVLFLHADTELPPQAFSKMLDAISTDAVAGAFDFAIRSPSTSLKWISRWACWRSRLTRIPFGDQAIFMALDTFNALGGYQNFPILEDVDLMRRLKQQQQPVKILCDRVTVSARRWEQEGILFCTLRNWWILSLYYLGVSPEYLAQWYRPLSTSIPKKQPANIQFGEEK